MVHWCQLFFNGKISPYFGPLNLKFFYLKQICQKVKPNDRWFTNSLSLNSKPIATHGKLLGLVEARL